MTLKNTSSAILKTSVKIVIYLLLAVSVYLLCTNAFKFGEMVFTDDGMAKEGQGIEIQITVPDGASAKTVGDILAKNGLIENSYAFVIQCFLYDGEINPGRYVLNTEYSPEEIVDALKKTENDENDEKENKK